MTMTFNPDDPRTWGGFRPLLMAHDVARSRDRSTAVVGGLHPYAPGRVGIGELVELPQGLFGHARTSALAEIDRRYLSNAVIITDFSNDATYAEIMYETFGPRVIGLHISRFGDGLQGERRPVKNGSLPVYTVGRTYLLELLHTELQAQRLRIVDGPMARRAYEQLNALEPVMRESEIVYKMPTGQHDDLGISCAMLVWAAGHPHLKQWVYPIEVALRPRRQPQRIDWRAWT